MAKNYSLLVAFVFCLCDIARAQSFDGTVSCNFGTLPYRVYFPANFTDTACVIHVSRGGNGLGDDRGQLLPYVNHYVENDYIVVQTDHRFAGSNIEQIAQFRGEEIACIASNIANGTLDFGSFQGTVDRKNQGFAGHSGGCMEGLEAAGTAMTHGNYFVPEIKAVFGMSPAGFLPDQFGIINSPPGFAAIQNTAVFVVIGEEEKDVNGTGVFMASDWRLQAYDAMSADGPRFEAFFTGDSTEHNDIPGNNTAIGAFNRDNSLAFFNTYLKGKDQLSQIGAISLPPDNTLVFSKKGVSLSKIKELDAVSPLHLYPNPIGAFVFCEKNMCNRVENIRFFDSLGHLVLETSSFPVNVSMLLPGAFIVQVIEASGHFYCQKLLKL